MQEFCPFAVTLVVFVHQTCMTLHKVVGSEIEDTYRGGQRFVTLGVDVQFLGFGLMHDSKKTSGPQGCYRFGWK